MPSLRPAAGWEVPGHPPTSLPATPPTLTSIPPMTMSEPHDQYKHRHGSHASPPRPPLHPPPLCVLWHHCSQLLTWHDCGVSNANELWFRWPPAKANAHNWQTPSRAWPLGPVLAPAWELLAMRRGTVSSLASRHGGGKSACWTCACKLYVVYDTTLMPCPHAPSPTLGGAFHPAFPSRCVADVGP